MHWLHVGLIPIATSYMHDGLTSYGWCAVSLFIAEQNVLTYRAIILQNFQCRGGILIRKKAGQGPAALAVDADGVVLIFFSRLSIFFSYGD